MSFNQNYTLEIISHHPQFANKSLRKYHVDGIDTVGAWGNEPFEIRFRNNTYQKVQVKISVDGTDVFTGKPADTNVSSDMWVVNGYGTLSLKAWPENNNGGAGFVFTSSENSVAIHTHGNMSSRGIVAAAVFTEGHVEPQRLNNYHYHYGFGGSLTVPNITIPTITTTPIWSNIVSNNTAGSLTGGGTYCNSTYNATCSMDSMNLCDDGIAANEAVPVGSRERKSLQSLVAVGAGQHVEQKITYVQGLIKPVLTDTVRVKYLWWDDLVAALSKANASSPQPSGFPGDGDKHNHINLGNTPRLPREGSFRRSEQPVYQRV